MKLLSPSLEWHLLCEEPLQQRKKHLPVVGSYPNTPKRSTYSLEGLKILSLIVSVSRPYLHFELNWVIQENILTIQGQLFRIPRARGQSLNWKSEGMGSLATEFPQGRDKNVFLENAYQAWTDDTVDDLRSRIQDQHPSISDVFVFICRRKPTKCGLESSFRGLNATKHPFSLMKTAS